MMKKLLISILILQLFIILNLLSLSRPIGDINRDGKVSLVDLVQLRQILIEQGENK